MKVELTNPQQLDTQFLLIWGLHFAGVDWEAGITNLLAICFVDEFGEVNATKSDQNLISHARCSTSNWCSLKKISYVHCSNVEHWMVKRGGTKPTLIMWTVSEEGGRFQIREHKGNVICLTSKFTMCLWRIQLLRIAHNFWITNKIFDNPDKRELNCRVSHSYFSGGKDLTQ